MEPKIIRVPKSVRRITKYPYPYILFAYDRGMTYFSLSVFVSLLWGTL